MKYFYSLLMICIGFVFALRIMTQTQNWTQPKTTAPIPAFTSKVSGFQQEEDNGRRNVDDQDSAAAKFSDRAFEQHIAKLKKSFDPSEPFTFIVQKPFVVIGNESPEIVDQRSRATVKWAVDHLKKDYFKRDPKHIINVWLFKDKVTYETYCVNLFGRKPTTPFGYYSSADRALVMNIATGGGTLVHEIVHPFIESNFQGCPSWFNEGLASLYEQSRDNQGTIQGLTNWRLRGLQLAIMDQSVPSFETLCSTTTDQFYRKDPGTNYAQARYLCYYLQQKGQLTKFYHSFVANHQQDPTGVKTLKQTLGVDDLVEFQETWQNFVQQLRFP